MVPYCTVTARRNESCSDGEGRPLEWKRAFAGTGKGEKIFIFRHLCNIATKKKDYYICHVCLSVPWKKLCFYFFFRERERTSRSALTKYTIKSLVYVSATNIYLEYIGYTFRPVNRSSSGNQSNKSKVLLRYWDPNI